LTDSDVVQDGIDSDYEEETGGRRRRWYVLIAVVLAVLLLLCSCVAVAEVWLLGSSEQARFVARNIECLQCHVELIPDLRKESVHNPFALKQCTTCHTPHGQEVRATVVKGPEELVNRYKTLVQWLPLRWWLTLSQRTTTSISTNSGSASTTTVKVQAGTSYLVAPESELCWTCHGSMGSKLGDTYQHQPFASGHCTGCHDPHASDHRVLLTQKVNEICFTCHPIGNEINRAQSHPPAKEGWCVDCHDPHASNFKGILVTRQRELCFSCHPTVAGLSGMPVQHAPFVNDNCTGCHQPHGSDFQPLLNAEQPTICYDCHPGIESQFGQPSHHPVGLDMQCGTCHDPHAAQYPGLLTAAGGSNSFCYECHNDVRASFASSEHQEQLCIRCHTPHGSAYAPLLVKRNPELCFQCHAQSDYDQSTATVFRNSRRVIIRTDQTKATCFATSLLPRTADA